MKVVINCSFGGFAVSATAVIRMRCEHEKRPWDGYGYNGHDGCAGSEEQVTLRTCPELVRVVEFLGTAANGEHADLAVVEIPDDIKWYIHEYNGSEHIAEQHRTWYGKGGGL